MPCGLDIITVKCNDCSRKLFKQYCDFMAIGLHCETNESA